MAMTTRCFLLDRQVMSVRRRKRLPRDRIVALSAGTSLYQICPFPLQRRARVPAGR
jgi:hypothetical protein